MTATAHLQDDSTFVLVPNVPESLYYKDIFRRLNPPITTTNTNLKDGDIVNLDDYYELWQIFDGKQWWLCTESQAKATINIPIRTVLVLKEKKHPLMEQLRSELTPEDKKMIDEVYLVEEKKDLPSVQPIPAIHPIAEADHIPRVDKMVEGIAEGEEAKPTPLTRKQVLELGFKELPHMTVMNSLIYDLGRKRNISIGCLGTPNEIVFISQVNHSDDKKIDDLVCLRNFDYDGYTTIEQLKNIINLNGNFEVYDTAKVEQLEEKELNEEEKLDFAFEVDQLHFEDDKREFLKVYKVIKQG